jgi:hypothetical protein
MGRVKEEAMSESKSRELEAMRLAVAQQNEAWARAREQLAALGDRILAVPSETLERIDAACAPRVGASVHLTLRA